MGHARCVAGGAAGQAARGSQEALEESGCYRGSDEEGSAAPTETRVAHTRWVRHGACERARGTRARFGRWWGRRGDTGTITCSFKEERQKCGWDEDVCWFRSERSAEAGRHTHIESYWNDWRRSEFPRRRRSDRILLWLDTWRADTGWDAWSVWQLQHSSQSGLIFPVWAVAGHPRRSRFFT